MPHAKAARIGIRLALTIVKNQNIWPGKKNRQRSARPDRPIISPPGPPTKRIRPTTENGRRQNKQWQAEILPPAPRKNNALRRRVRRFRCKFSGTWAPWVLCASLSRKRRSGLAKSVKPPAAGPEILHQPSRVLLLTYRMLPEREGQLSTRRCAQYGSVAQLVEQ